MTTSAPPVAAPVVARDAPRTAGWLVTAAACGLLLGLCWLLRDFVTDDSWISVRYAENLARGEGPVWNPGGPRVEGYSNPALVGVEALADAVGWSALSAARALGVVSGLACVVLVHGLGRAVVGPVAAAVGAVLTAAGAPFALWSVGGLETTATAAVVTAGVLLVARPDGGRPALAGALLAVLPWLRPEGLVVALGVAAAAEGVGLLRRTSRRPALRRLALLAGIPVLSQAVLEVVRLGVYGHLLPNSVLYKSGTGETFGVLLKLVGHSTVVLVLAVVGLVLLRRRQLVLAVPAAVYLVGSIGTLDSANSYSRFFMPVWPQLALLAAVAIAGLAGLARRRGAAGSGRVRAAVAAALTAVTVILTLAHLPGSAGEVDRWQERYMGCRAAARADVARWLVERTDPGTVFSISDAGLVPARAGGRPVIDAFMLNDPLIQRTGPLSYRERADIVHERRPDVLVLASRSADTFDPAYPTDRAVGTHPAAADFTLAHVGTGEPGCGYHLWVMQR